MLCFKLAQPLQELKGHKFKVQVLASHVSEAYKGKLGTGVHVSGMSVASHDEQSLLLLGPPLGQVLRMLLVKSPARDGVTIVKKNMRASIAEVF